MKIKATILLCLFTAYFINAQTKVSKKSGNWGNSGTWLPSGVPTSTDNVVIADGHKVRIDGNYACNSLTVGTSNVSLSTLEFKGGAHSFTVFGNVQVNNSDTIDIKMNSNTTHTITFMGDIINNGGIQLSPDFNSKCISIFNKNGNQTISGTGSFSKFSDIVLNTGTNANNILDVSVSNFTVPVNFLKLINGTLKISTTNPQNITTFTAATTIPATAGIWLNSPNLIVNTQNSITNSGIITVSSGTLNIGDAVNEDFLYSAGTFSMASGLLNVAGKYSGVGNCNFTISNGTFKVANLGSTDVVNAPFQILSAGANFNMLGGSIIIQREGGSGTQDLGYVNLAGLGSVTGGTLQVGTSTSPANQIINLKSTLSVGNLLINNSTITASLNTNPLTVINSVIINNGTFNANNLGITLGGNWQNNGGTFCKNR